MTTNNNYLIEDGETPIIGGGDVNGTDYFERQRVLKERKYSLKKERDAKPLILLDQHYVLRGFLHKLHYARAVYMSHEKTMEGLDLISEWSYAHRVGNGMLGQDETELLINEVLKKMDEF